MTQKLEQTAPSQWSGEDKILMELVSRLYQWSMLYYQMPLPIIPTADPNDEAWLSPWDVIRAHFHDQSMTQEINALFDLTRAYRDHDPVTMAASATLFQNSVTGRAIKSQRKNIQKIPLELAYNKTGLFGWAKLFYLITFILFLFSFTNQRETLRHVALLMLVLGGIPHLVALIIRCIVMSRPPVTNLFETFIFVGLISVLIGVVVELTNKRWVGIMVGSFLGTLFLAIASKFSAEGDTMKMLVAVLDSNFWLGTHVVTITIGYAGCCAAGLIGHMYLIQNIFYARQKEVLQSTYRNLMGTLIFGLALTFLGTFLGGIWADQSWGRFWGWDPKENGALLIVLWCSIILHAKVGRLIGPVGVAVFSALGLIVVMWAWFGVNLLSVGLHSYGFTSGMATSLLIYVLFEILFIAAVLIHHNKKRRKVNV